MTINFPSNPTQSQHYTFNSSIWIYNGYAWVLASSAGTSGTSGTSGSGSGTSGSGAPGTSGTSGSSGSSGIGFSGTDGTSGTSGSSGTSGTSGSSGTSGIGTPGTSGTSGSSGTSGTRGTSGTSGSSGTSGTRGTSGTSGSSGTSGVGTPGTPGAPGTSGTSGTSASGGGSSFTYAYTLFVDPNGDDGSALEGRLDLPWQTIGSAIQYCEDNILSNYTIWVFPGIYTENQWTFKYSVNTTVKLNGGVKIIFGLKNPDTYLIGAAADFSIVGDDRENNYDSPNSLITFDKETHNIPDTIFLFNTEGINVRISNVSLYGDPYRYAFMLVHCSNIKLHIVNSFVRSLRNNIIVLDSSSVPKVAIINSILVSGVDTKHIQFANIRVDTNFSINPEVRFFNGIWNFENVRFISYGDTEIDTEKGHITSNTLGAELAMYVTLSNCKFYMNQARAIDIWYDNGTLGNNRLEIVGTSIANSNADYNSLGSTIVYLGDPSFIVTRQDIIDPIDIMI